MFTIIHGSHRHGYSWEFACDLRTKINEYGMEVVLIDLSVANIDYCCGSQVCQETECIYVQDDFAKIFKDQLMQSDGIFIVTPTYFNMPPAKLKNFIDRTNALLPILEDSEKHPFFGAYVCGEADDESVNYNLNLLKEYASIMGWKNIEQLNIAECLTDTSNIVCNKIKAIAELIYKEFQSKGE